MENLHQAVAEPENIKKAWIHSFLTPQTIFYILGGMIAIVIFWTRTQESWAKVKAIEGDMLLRADKADLKAIEERVSRQWETSNKILERIIVLEKQQEYQRGFTEGKKSE